ncbi:MAG: FG-GAP repeat domain-containing protein, partial [Bradymonadaceae bacterium]
TQSACTAAALGDGIVSSWAVASIRDRWGNTIDFDYHREQVTGSSATMERYPAQILYNRNVHQFNRLLQRVVFEYEDRVDSFEGYNRGLLRQRTKLLTRIRTQTLSNEAPLEVLSYHLDYDVGIGGRSLLTQIYRCDAWDVCQPPTKFEWTSPANEDRYETPANPLIHADYLSPNLRLSRRHGPIVGDFNGDGRNDILYLTATHFEGTYSDVEWIIARGESAGEDGRGSIMDAQRVHFDLPPYLSYSPVDFNGNGLTDLLVTDPGGDKWVVYVTYVETDGRIRFYEHVTTTSKEVPIEGMTYLVDFNGNGRLDLITCEREDGSDGSDHASWRVRFQSESGWGSYSTLNVPVDCRWTDVLVFDANGDGITNFLVAARTEPNASDPYFSHFVAFGAAGIGIESWTTEINRGPNNYYKVMDVNGDGLQDVVMVFVKPLDSLDAIETFVWLNTGKGFVLEHDFFDPDDIVHHYFNIGNRRYEDFTSRWRMALVFDYNGDGKDDLLIPILHDKYHWENNTASYPEGYDPADVPCIVPSDSSTACDPTDVKGDIGEWAVLLSTGDGFELQLLGIPFNPYENEPPSGGYDVHWSDTMGTEAYKFKGYSFQSPRIVDLSGEGRPDLVIWNHGGIHRDDVQGPELYQHGAPFVPRIEKIRDGFIGIDESHADWEDTWSHKIEYRPLTDPSVYLKQGCHSSRIGCLQPSSMHV